MPADLTIGAASAGSSTLTNVLTGVPSAVKPSIAAGDSSKATGQADSVVFSKAALAAQQKSTVAGKELSPQEKAAVEKLKQADRQVRQHEQAHLAAAGGYARGGAKFSYTTGPDGKQYATGGEVSIDVSPASTPQGTVQKMETVKRAATAPADPSAQDRAVYAAAQKAETEAQQKIQKERTEKASETKGQAASALSPGTSTGEGAGMAPSVEGQSAANGYNAAASVVSVSPTQVPRLDISV